MALYPRRRCFTKPAVPAKPYKDVFYMNGLGLSLDVRSPPPSSPPVPPLSSVCTLFYLPACLRTPESFILQLPAICF